MHLKAKSAIKKCSLVKGTYKDCAECAKCKGLTPACAAAACWDGQMSRLVGRLNEVWVRNAGQTVEDASPV